MTCLQLDRWIAEQSGRLPAVPDALAAHAAACARCTRAVAAESVVRAALQDHAWPALPDGTRALLTDLRSDGAELATGSHLRRRLLPEVALVTVCVVALAVMVQTLSTIPPTAEPRAPDKDAYGPPRSMASGPGFVRYATDGTEQEVGAVPLQIRAVPRVAAAVLASCSAAAWVIDGAAASVPCPAAAASAPASPKAGPPGYPGPGDTLVSVPAMALDRVFTAPGIHHPALYITTTDGVVAVPWGTVIAQGRVPGPGRRLSALGWGLWGIWLAAGVLALVLWQRSAKRYQLALAAGLAALALAGSAVLLSSDPLPLLRPTMDGLIGSRGLDPLDPTVELRSYEFGRVEAAPSGRFVTVTLRAAYADGTARDYDMPIPSRGRFGRDGREDPLGRLRAEHRELPGLPFGESAFESVRRIELGPPADAILTHPANWGWSTGCLSADAVAASPDGRTFTVNRAPGYDDEVWLVGERLEAPVLLGSNVMDHGFTTDGGYAFAVLEEGEGARLRVLDVDSGRFVVDTVNGPPVVPDSAADKDSGKAGRPLSTRIRPGPARGSGPAREVLWVALPDGVFVLELPEGRWTRTDVDYGPPKQGPYWVSPDPTGSDLALACDDGLCFRRASLVWGKDGINVVALPVAQVEHAAAIDPGPVGVPLEIIHRLAWDPIGSRIVAIEAAGIQPYGSQAPPRLVEFFRDGTVRRSVNPGGESIEWWTGSTGWLTNERVLLSVCIHGGRRLVTVDLPALASESATVRDVTPRLWDAWASVVPRGADAAGTATVILFNGRGSLWRATTPKDR